MHLNSAGSGLAISIMVQHIEGGANNCTLAPPFTVEFIQVKMRSESIKPVVNTS